MKQEEMIEAKVSVILDEVNVGLQSVDWGVSKIMELFKLASTPKVNLVEVEKLLQEFIRTENSLRELRWITTLGVEITADAYRKVIGYTLSDLPKKD